MGPARRGQCPAVARALTLSEARAPAAGGQVRRLPGRYGAIMRTVAATRAISMVSRKASNAFTPRAQRTSQRMRPKVLATMTPMERGTLAEAARAERRARDPRPSGAVCAPDDR